MFVTSHSPRNAYNYCNNIHPGPGWARWQCLPNSVTCPNLLPPAPGTHWYVVSPLSFVPDWSPHLTPSHSSPQARETNIGLINQLKTNIVSGMLDPFFSLVALSGWLAQWPGPDGMPRWGEVHSVKICPEATSHWDLAGAPGPGQGGGRPVSGPWYQPSLSPAHFKYLLDGILEFSSLVLQQTHNAENLLISLDCKVSWMTQMCVTHVMFHVIL